MVYTNDKMRADIQRIIEEAGYDFHCSGHQDDDNSELVLEELKLDDADSTINEILGIVSDYIAEML